ncbi:MAG: metallophosphoesterase [Planctomycetota bacterium]|jgi:putative phosphoesterase
MKIGIISDTHNHRANVLKAIKTFNEQKVGWILHAGDMTSENTAGEFAAVDGAKFIAVLGNCDSERDLLKSTIESFGGELYDPSFSGQIDGKRVFMTHKPDVLEAAVESGKYDLVVYGHTHKQDIRKVGQTLVVNPGKAKSRLGGNVGVVIVELDDMNCEVIAL